MKLDFVEARPAAQLIEIEVIGGAGSIVLVLPAGWAADADRVSKAFGSKTVKVPREPGPGMPLLVLHGSVGVGSLRVRPPNRLQRRSGAKARGDELDR